MKDINFRILTKKTSVSPNMPNIEIFLPTKDNDILVLKEYKKNELLEPVINNTFQKVLLTAGVFSNKCKSCQENTYEIMVDDYKFLVKKYTVKYKGGKEAIYEPVLIQELK